MSRKKRKLTLYYCPHCGYGNYLEWGYCMRPSCRKKFPITVARKKSRLK